MQNIGQTRLRKELADLERDPPPGIVCYPTDDSDITHLESYIKGPPDSPFEHGTFRIDVKITDSYPFDPPQMRFKTKIYHPNIDEGGRICADILKKGVHGGWKPSLNLSTTLLSLQSLLSGPNPNDPLDAEIAREYTLDYERFVCKAKEFTTRYATGSSIEVDSTAIGSDTKENTDQPEDDSPFSDHLSEIMLQDKPQKGKKRMLSLSSRKRKKPSADSQPETDYLAAGGNGGKSSSMTDEPLPSHPSSSICTPPIGSSSEDLSSPAPSSIEVVCISSQESDTVTTTAAEQASLLSHIATASQPFSSSEEQESVGVSKEPENDIPSNTANEAEPTSQHAQRPAEGNGDNETSAPTRLSTRCRIPDKLQDLPVNIISLDDEAGKPAGLIKKKNKLSLSRTKRQKQQS